MGSQNSLLGCAPPKKHHLERMRVFSSSSTKYALL